MEGPTPKVFKLLMTPFLVREAIISHMDPASAFLFSQSSKRARFMMTSNKLKLKFYFAIYIKEEINMFPRGPDDYLISINGMENNQDGRSYFRTDFGELINVKASTGLDCRLVFYTTSKLSTFKNLHQELQKLFTLDYDMFFYDLQQTDILYMDVYKMFLESQMRFRKSTIEGTLADNQLAETILRNVNISGGIFINSVFNHDLRISNWIINNDAIWVSNAHWFRIENLRESSCVCAKLKNPNITDIDLNNFLRHLINGGNPNLQLFVMFMERDYDINVIFGNITTEERNRRRKYKHNGIVAEESSNALSFTLQSGVEASMSFYWEIHTRLNVIGLILFRGQDQ